MVLLMVKLMTAAQPVLTPLERWAAARRFGSGYLQSPWFTLVCTIVLMALAGLLVWVSLAQRGRLRPRGDSFFEIASQLGLSPRESQILYAVADRAGLRRKESIFTMPTAFDRGCAVVLQEGLEQHQNAEQAEQLRAELAVLREKLGFRKRRFTSVGSPSRARRLSSRQIPVGKKLYLTRRRCRDSADVVATVVANTDMELSVSLARPVTIMFGESWSVRYYSGRSVWEFDTTVISYDGQTLSLNHNDAVRLVNRRRFLRVPVQRPALVAPFPFSTVAAAQADCSAGSQETGHHVEQSGVDLPTAPTFVAGTVTELAGPGLRVESPLKLEPGDRLLIVFTLNDPQHINADQCEMIQDIAEVRHVTALASGCSAAVELTGLSDMDLEKLVRVTNTAAIRARESRTEASASVTAETTARQVTEVAGA